MGALEWSIQVAAYLDEEPEMAESKGWLGGSIVLIDGRRIPVTFYDPARLAQNVEAAVRTRGYFSEGALVVVPSITRANIEKAVAAIAEQGWSELLGS